jgi:tetratricopeptide (TPR) repeat protein
MVRTTAIVLALWLFSACGHLAAQTADAAKTARRAGDELYRQREFEKAVEAFTRSLEADPNQPEVRVRRGDCYFALRKVNRAIGDYTEALQTHPDGTVPLVRRANAWWALKIHQRALDDCRAALEIHPDAPSALEIRATILYQRGDYDGALRDAKKLVLFSADWSEANLHLANSHFARGEFESAIQAYDRALLMSPHNADAWYWSAEACLALGEEDAAAERIQRLIRTNPEQRGGYARQSPSYREPTPDDLAHGRRQVEQLFKDRPAMASDVTPDDEVFQWAARKFAGEDLPGRMLWDRQPPDRAWADHFSPQSGRPARVRLRPALPQAIGSLTRTFDFDELWSMFAFELHNVQSYQRSHELSELARDGHLTREGFVRESARLEYHALQRTRAWYLECYRPWAKKRGIPTDGRIWRIDVPLTFDEFMELYQDKRNYPWVPYLSYYDQLQKSQRSATETDKAGE